MKRLVHILFLLAIGSFLLFCSGDTRKEKVEISEFMAYNLSSVADDEGEFSDWIEIFNPTKDSLDLEGYFLSDNAEKLKKHRVGKSILGPGERKVFWCSKKESSANSLNFKLARAGGEIFLVDKNGKTILDHVKYSEQVADFSSEKTKGEWRISESSTPGKEPHKKAKSLTIAPEVNISIVEKENKIEVTLSAAQNGEIRYTLNGKSILESPGMVYSEPLLLDSILSISAAVYGEDYINLYENRKAFIPSGIHDLPVLSLVTDPNNLWNDSTGIYVEGLFKNYDNRTDTCERDGFLEYRNEEGISVSHDVEFKIYGAGTRKRPKKSITVKGDIPNYFFDSRGDENLDGIVVRACYSDASRFKNEVVKGVNDIMSSDLLMQEYKPAVLYINGQYWGLFNIYERKNDKFIQAHEHQKVKHLINANSRKPFAEKGNFNDYEELLDSLNNIDITSAEGFDYISSRFEIPSLLDFWCQEMYTLKADRFNNRFWKSKGDSSKWSYVGYDFDIGFVWPDNPRTHKYFKPKKAEGIEIFGRLMENPDFARLFFERMCDYLNYGYTEENVNRILVETNKLTEEEFKRDFERWKIEWPKCLDKGEHQIKMINKFIAPRADYLRDSIARTFGFTEQIVFTNPSPEKGTLLVNGYEVKEKAIYFKDMILSVKIESNEGWVTKGLVNENGQKVIEGEVKLSIPGNFVATFEED